MAIFTTCAYCGGVTRVVRNIEPTVDVDEAKRLKLYDLFEHHYRRRCALRGVTAEGPIEEVSSA